MYTNQFYINYIWYKAEASRYSIITTDANRNKININDIKENRWNHILIEVYYDPKLEYDRKTVIYYQSRYHSENLEPIDRSENQFPLKYIYFCNGRKTTCHNNDVTWYCAFYRNLRLFNGLLANRYVAYRYDEYFSDYKYLLSSIKLYYPLYGHYIANNLLSQYRSKESALNTNSPTNNWNFPQYAYDMI